MGLHGGICPRPWCLIGEKKEDFTRSRKSGERMLTNFRTIHLVFAVIFDTMFSNFVFFLDADSASFYWASERCHI